MFIEKGSGQPGGGLSCFLVVFVKRTLLAEQSRLTIVIEWLYLVVSYVVNEPKISSVMKFVSQYASIFAEVLVCLLLVACLCFSFLSFSGCVK